MAQFQVRTTLKRSFHGARKPQITHRNQNKFLVTSIRHKSVFDSTQQQAVFGPEFRHGGRIQITDSLVDTALWVVRTYSHLHST